MRVTVLASTIPLLLAGVVAGGDLVPSASPCIAMGRASMQIATAPWQNPLYVSFTDDPEMATVRVQVVDAADMADFTVTDGAMTAEPDSCTVTRNTAFVSISDRHITDTDPVIYLSRDPGADYRVFVQSRAFSTKDAAALVVGAGRRVHPTERSM